MDCEKFTSHLGPIGDFLTAKNQNLDVHNSPLKFENTYNGHSFVARMSHDQSFVARIEIDHDIVRDCPEPSRRSSSIEVRADESIMMNTPMMNNANATKYSIGVLGEDNATILAPKLEEASEVGTFTIIQVSQPRFTTSPLEEVLPCPIFISLAV